MALIGEIRQRSWLLILMIGLGMGGFLLMDMIGNNGSSIFSNRNTVGEIAGEDVSITEFQRRQEQLYGQSAADPFSVREGTWQFYVREAIIQKEAAALGLGVSEEELNELLYGPNPQTISPVIRQQLGDPQTGQIDMERLANIRRAVEGGQIVGAELASWNSLIEQVKLDRLETKINTIAASAIYTPSWMAEMEHNATNQKADFRFVSIPYATIEDKEVKVTESEIKSYIKENSGKFKSNEETRKFSYVLFDVEPTQKDSADIAEKLINEIDSWTSTDDDSLFVVNSTGGIYSETYVKKDELAPQVADTLAQIANGTIIGPYIDGSKYKIAKLLDKKVIPDSVDVRHILRNVDVNAQNAFEIAQTQRKLLDSLITELENGVSFDSLAAQFSEDPGSKDKGGVYEAVPPGRMVQQFNDYIFYQGDVGEYKIVGTQFGLHLIEVTRKYNTSNSTGYQVAYIQESIIPSQDTEKDVLRNAAKFAASLKDLDDLQAKAKKEGYEVQTTTIGAKRNDYRLMGIGNGQAARDIIKWGYDADKNDASREVYTFENEGDDLFIDKYAVVALQEVVSEGLATSSAEAETAVRNRKKAEMIMAKIKKGQALDAVASANSSQVQTASQVNFSTTNVPGMGNEPKVVGKVFSASTKTNEVSAPIAGNTAVYVIEVTFKPEPTTPTDLPTAKQQASAALKGQVRGRLYQSLLEQTEVNDYRYRFF
ncbi:MAG: peptidylprolyl isomerase [Saprospiraceae bacterium]